MSNKLNIHQPLVGVGVLILKDGKVLLGKRKNSHGDGEYAAPGGHLEYREGFEECARREIAEECGVEVDNIQFQILTNIDTWKPKHYVHIGLTADWVSGEPQVLEPDKCESWDWYTLDNLPGPIFFAAQQQLDALQSGERYFDLQR